MDVFILHVYGWRRKSEGKGRRGKGWLIPQKGTMHALNWFEISLTLYLFHFRDHNQHIAFDFWGWDYHQLTTSGQNDYSSFFIYFFGQVIVSFLIMTILLLLGCLKTLYISIVPCKRWTCGVKKMQAGIPFICICENNF